MSIVGWGGSWTFLEADGIEVIIRFSFPILIAGLLLYRTRNGSNLSLALIGIGGGFVLIYTINFMVDKMFKFSHVPAMFIIHNLIAGLVLIIASVATAMAFARQVPQLQVVSRLAAPITALLILFIPFQIVLVFSSLSSFTTPSGSAESTRCSCLCTRPATRSVSRRFLSCSSTLGPSSWATSLRGWAKRSNPTAASGSSRACLRKCLHKLECSSRACLRKLECSSRACLRNLECSPGCLRNRSSPACRHSNLDPLLPATRLRIKGRRRPDIQGNHNNHNNHNNNHNNNNHNKDRPIRDPPVLVRKGPVVRDRAVAAGLHRVAVSSET